MTSEFIATKMCEGMYHPEEFVAMEVEILRTLGWRLSGPIPHDYIAYFVELLPACTDKTTTKVFVNEAKRHAEAAMMDYSIALEPLSSIALVSLVNFVRASSADMVTHIDVTGWLNFIGCVLSGSNNFIE